MDYRKGNYAYDRGTLIDIRTSQIVYMLQGLHGENIKPVPINESTLIELLGYKYYNGKTSGPLTKDFPAKLDVDYIDGIIQIKSHYEETPLYRPLEHIKYIHQLQNLFYDLGQEKLAEKLIRI